MSNAPFGRRRTTVVDRRQLGDYVIIDVADPLGPAPRAGQFYMLASSVRWGGGAGDRPFLPRAFSVLGAGAGRVEFLLDDVGPGSHRLAELSCGDELWMVGPLGNPFPPAAGPVLLVGGGVGIAPLALLQRELGGARALLGFRDAAHARGVELFSAAELATDDGSVGLHGRVTELLAAHLDPSVTVCACGPPAMLEAVRAQCVAAGVPAQLALESPMACGFGACYGCVVETREGYRRVCVDGPVFEAKDLAAVA